MADEPTKIRDVAWNEMFPWLILTRTVRIALLARVLILGALGLLATMAGWSLLADLFSHSSDPVITNWTQGTSLALWDHSFDTAVHNPWVITSAPSAWEVFDSSTRGLVQAPISIWVYLTQPFIQMFHGGLKPVGFLFLLLCGIWELLVWGLVGGAITRIAALKFTRDEAPGMIAALKHAAGKLPSYSLPPFIALAGTSVFGLQLVVLGFIMRLSIFAFLAALAWPFVLVLGLMMAVLLLGALAGWPLDVGHSQRGRHRRFRRPEPQLRLHLSPPVATSLVCTVRRVFSGGQYVRREIIRIECDRAWELVDRLGTRRRNNAQRGFTAVAARSRSRAARH